MKKTLPIRHSASTGLTLIELFVLVAIIVVLVGFLIPPCGSRIGNKGRRTDSLSNAKQVAVALRMYAEDHGGNFPSTRIDGKPFAHGDFSNQAFEQVMPKYCTNKKLFRNNASAWCKEPATDVGETDIYRIKRGQNDWIYVTDLKNESDPNWPLIATATASATNLTYTNSKTAKGGVWEGKAAIIAYVDGSARPLTDGDMDLTDKTKTFPKRQDTGTNIFIGTSDWLGTGRLILAPE